MALIKCKECGNQMSTEAKACPHCGAKSPKMPMWKKLAIGVFSLIILGQVLGSLDKDKSSATQSAAAPTVAVPAAPPAPQVQRWEVSEYSDEMSGTTTKAYRLIAQESLNLEFPYQGRNMGHLYVRFPSKGKPDAFFELDKGNLVCGYRDCAMKVKFDDEAPVSFSASKSTDNSSNVLFFDNPQRFIQKARTAKQIFVEVNFFQQGYQLVKFRPADPLPQ